MNKRSPDRVRENNLDEVLENVPVNSEPVATTSYQQNEPTTQPTTTVPGHTSTQATHQRNFYSKLSLRNFLKAFKSYVLSSEDDIRLHYSVKKDQIINTVPEKEPMFVIVESSGLSNPSSKELVVDRKHCHNTDTVFTKNLNKHVIPNDFPSTSKDITADNMFHFPPVMESVSADEVQMIDINLQSDNAIPVEDFDENDSVVLSYLRSKKIFTEMDGTLLSNKRKSSMLESLPKLETIVEGKQLAESSDQTLDVKFDEEDKEEQK